MFLVEVTHLAVSPRCSLKVKKPFLVLGVINMSPELAQTIALQALAWLVGNDDLCPVFLGATGSSVDDLRDQAMDPAFQASVLEFLTNDDAWVMAFCDTVELAYDQPLMARYAIPGAEAVHWT
jgi:hypothetical protein